MLLVYSHKITNRLTYILDFVIVQNLGLDYRLTTLRDEFMNFEGARLNYSYEPIPNTVHIKPALLLSQEDIVPQLIEVKEHLGKVIFFCTDQGELPFDIFAASFYLISRYEEYLVSKLDRFGRYDPRNSIAWKKSFLFEPIVNIWIGWLSTILQQSFSELPIKEPVYKFMPTIDVDNAYAYSNKGIIRQIGGLGQSLVRADFTDFTRRLKVFSGRIADPFDTYEALYQIHYRYNLSPVYFFLLANYGGLDKAVPIHNKKFQELILLHSQKHKVGIHPSFSSFFDFTVLENEIATLAELLSQDVTNSRFHFVKFALPNNYENLIKLNVTDDYSMGYPSRIGFRCGYAGEYQFFNLQTNRATSLVIHPFQVMDAALNSYMKLSPDDAVFQTRQIIDKIKEVGGTFSLLWHNESLCNYGAWQGWAPVYEQIVRYAVE